MSLRGSCDGCKGLILGEKLLNLLLPSFIVGASSLVGMFILYIFREYQLAVYLIFPMAGGFGFALFSLIYTSRQFSQKGMQN